MADLIKRLHHHANGDCDMTPVGSTLLEAADRIEELAKERERLALAICGGEDAVGYANAQPVEVLEQVARDNAAMTTWQFNQTMHAEAKLTKAVAFIRRHIPDSAYEQRQRSNAFLAELDGK